MSLLMEALKKAEEAKRRAAGESAAGNSPAPQKPELTLEPLPASGSRLPDLAQHIDAVDADLAAVSSDKPARPQPSRSAPGSLSNGHRETAARAAVHTVFAAKQSPSPSNTLWIILGLGVLAALCLGGYFWWQLHNVSRGSLPLTSPPAAARSAANYSPLPPVQPTPPETRFPEENQLESKPSAPAPLSTPAASKLFTDRISAARGKSHEQYNESPVRLTHSRPRPDATLEQAYDALLAGKADAAGRGYENVLRRDPKNTDALLGMATIAAMQGQKESANIYYLRALESNPTDATALAGVISGQGQIDPGIAESRLKTALTSQPDSPALLFALGNLYAGQRRWSEAQQTYFKAYSSEPDNADFIFNLAVSLDHLHKSRLAVQYYEMALDASASRPAAFDRERTRSRIRELQP